MQIEEGKIYRARDGRKVGPMRSSYHPDFVWAGPVNDGEEQIVTASGQFFRGGIADPRDLIAEWVDEPAEVANSVVRKYPTTEPATPPEPEWIPWAGGECPVHPEAYVEVLTSDGVAPFRSRAANLAWGKSAVITNGAYRVLWSPTIEPVKRSGEVWVNVYEATDGAEADVLLSRADADSAAAFMKVKRLACIRVPWTEGEWI